MHCELLVVPSVAVLVPSGQDTHEVAALSGWYVPRGQRLHGEMLLLEYWPGWHTSGRG